MNEIEKEREILFQKGHDEKNEKKREGNFQCKRKLKYII